MESPLVQIVLDFCDSIDIYTPGLLRLNYNSLQNAYDAVETALADIEQILQAKKWKREAAIYQVFISHIHSLYGVSMEFRHRVEDLNIAINLGDKEELADLLMELYFSICRPKVCEYCASVDDSITNDTYTIVWVGIVFRAICWHNLHTIDDGLRPVSPEFFESQLPVYISYRLR